MTDVTTNNDTNVQSDTFIETPMYKDTSTHATLNRAIGYHITLPLLDIAILAKVQSDHPEADVTEVLVTHPSGEYRYTWADFLARLGIAE